MSVAKSFQSFEMLSDKPYVINGRQYVMVRNPKTGHDRQVRWYEDKISNQDIPVEIAQNGTQKDVLGFQKGYITIFKGDTYTYLDWFRQSIARYAKWWGWYVISTDELPEDIPADLTPVSLQWSNVGNEDGNLKAEAVIKEAVDTLLYEESPSDYVGEVGERLEIEAIVKRAIELDGNYGSSTMHIMEDCYGNVFVWTTTSKNWKEGTTKHFKGTVKAHRAYKNVRQTVLTRCLEVK